MSWQGGRQLASMQKDGTTLSFSYNDAGLRTEKTVNGSTRRYIWNSSHLMADVGASDAFYFHYSSGGELIGYTYKTANAETECILVKNQQGDVERVISADGTILASYTYDAWGNVLTSEGSLASANPIRYRGYYFDTETSLYYLQSRYYDPAVGRFINADGCVTTNFSGLLSANVFAYCENTPANAVDSQGQAMMRDVSSEMMGGLAIVSLLPLATITSQQAGRKLDEFAKNAYAFINSIAQKLNKRNDGPEQLYTVYFLQDKNGDVQYVGRVKTQYFAARMRHHFRTRGLTPKYYIPGLTYEEARGLEEEGMWRYHTLKKGIPINNQIHGINPSSNDYEIYMGAAEKYLSNQVENFFLNLIP